MKKMQLLLAIVFLLPSFSYANDQKLNKLETLQRHIKKDGANESLKFRFVQVASGIDLSSLEMAGKENKSDLISEIKDLATPLVQTVKRISERPRKMEALKNKISLQEIQIIKIKDSIRVLRDMATFKKYGALKSEFGQVRRWLENKYDQISLNLDSNRNQLKNLKSEKRSIVDTIRDVLSTFFKTKGKNLLVAVFGFLVIIFGMTFLRNKIFGLSLFRNNFSFARKPLLALYSMLTFLMAIISAMICLYVLNDWLLVTLVIFILMGLAWSLKNFIPQFFDEIKLILNFGTVREGEKIYWDGIPWRVDKLSFYSKLSNDALEGGEIRVSSKKLLDFHSRKVSASEPWFPTRKGDWILIGGESLGQVLIQTPDQIVVDKIGGGQVHYTCGDFMGLKIENLSAGYSLTGSFGVDYELQKDFSENLLEYFKEGFRCKLELIDGIEKIGVDFGDCGADSLNIFVRIDCAGRVASGYGANKRAMQKAFLDLCNERNYSIPFKQLTVHLNQNEQH